MDALDMSCLQQGTPEWHKARLGKITSSMVYNVMLMPSKKAQAEGELFSDTAKSYLYKLASERNIDKLYLEDDILFSEYLERVSISTKDMRYGSDNEEQARTGYILQSDNEVVTCGFICAPDEFLKNVYGDSPDGVIIDAAGNPLGCLEIKCPKPETWIRYRHLFNTGASLKDVEEKYYWQCQSHMYCNKVQWCDFVIYDKMQVDGLYIIRVMRNQDDIDAMLERIRLADKFINELLT